MRGEPEQQSYLAQDSVETPGRESHRCKQEATQKMPRACEKLIKPTERKGLTYHSQREAARWQWRCPGGLPCSTRHWAQSPASIRLASKTADQSKLNSVRNNRYAGSARGTVDVGAVQPLQEADAQLQIHHIACKNKATAKDTLISKARWIRSQLKNATNRE